MPEHRRDETLRLSGKRYENLDDYVRGLLAAIRTRERLTGRDDLTIEIQPDDELPLVQRLLLR